LWETTVETSAVSQRMGLVRHVGRVFTAPRHDPEGGSRERPGRLSDGPQDAPWREDMMDDAAYDLCLGES
jgi:hypothetical protein